MSPWSRHARTGASIPHNLIVGNLVAALVNCLRDTPCRVFPSDLRVRLPGGRRFFYPDVSVVCGEIQFADDKKDVILNPDLVVEVLSESTAAYDRGMKFLSYQQIPSLREYLLVSQDDPLVEHYVRQNDESWIYTKAAGLDASLALPSVGCEIALRDLYDKVS